MATRAELIAEMEGTLDGILDAAQEAAGAYMADRLRDRLDGLEALFPNHLPTVSNGYITDPAHVSGYMEGAQNALGAAVVEVFESNDWRPEFLGAVADAILLHGGDSLDPHPAVRVLLTADTTLSGLGTYDDVTLLAGDRVGVIGNSPASENGIWIADSGPWTRATDMDVTGELVRNSFFAVTEGTAHGGTSWICITPNPITLGTTDTTWALYQSSLSIAGGDGLVRTGNTLHVGAGTGIQVNADSIQISPTYAGQSSIVTVGTVASGTWQGSVVGPTFGGTGLNAYALGDLLYGSGVNTLARLPANGNAQRRFLMSVNSNAPAWDPLADADIPATLVRTSRTIGTTGPLTGGGSLAGNLTLSLSGLSGLGAANTVIGMNAAGSALEYKGLVGTSNRLTVNHAAGSVSFDIAGTYIGQASITTLGTITTGVWNGSAIGVGYGGTGHSNYVVGDLLYASATATLSRLAGNTLAARRFLTQIGNGSASAAPAWTAITAADVGSGANLVGTANQVNLSASGSGVLLGSTAITLSLPQNIHTGATPSFSGIRLNSFNTQWTVPFVANTSGDLSASTSFTFNSSTDTLGMVNAAFSGNITNGANVAANRVVIANPSGQFRSSDALTFVAATGVLGVGSRVNIGGATDNASFALNIAGAGIAVAGQNSILSYSLLGNPGDTNYERMSLIHTGAAAELRSQANGTGTLWPLRLVVGATTRYEVTSAGAHTLTGDVTITGTLAAGAITAPSLIVPDGGGVFSVASAANRGLIRRNGSAIEVGDTTFWSGISYRTATGAHALQVGGTTYLSVAANGLTFTGPVVHNIATTGIAYDMDNRTGNHGLRIRSGNNELNDGSEYVLQLLAGTTGNSLFAVNSGGLIQAPGDVNIQRTQGGGDVYASVQNLSTDPGSDAYTMVQVQGGTGSYAYSRYVANSINWSFGALEGGTFQFNRQNGSGGNPIFSVDASRNTTFHATLYAAQQFQATGIATFLGGIHVAGGAGSGTYTARGEIYSNATSGLVIVGRAGSSTSWVLARGSDGNSVLDNAAGSLNARFYGSAQVLDNQGMVTLFASTSTTMIGRIGSLIVLGEDTGWSGARYRIATGAHAFNVGGTTSFSVSAALNWSSADLVVGTNVLTAMGHSPGQRLVQLHGIAGAALFQAISNRNAINETVGAYEFGTANTTASEKRSALIASTLRAASGTQVTGDLAFYTNIAGTLAERGRFFPGGNLVIGKTTDGGQRFQVSGTSDFAGNMTLTTITAGTWNGTSIAAGFGGTGHSNYVLGDLLYASGTATLARLAGNTTTARRYLRQTGTGSASAAPAWDAIADADLPSTVVRTTRTINTTAPLTGGGTLAADRTFGLAGLSTIGGANQLVGVNGAGSGWEYKTLNGATNRIVVTLAAGSITISAPQDIHTGAAPTFSGLTLSGLAAGSGTRLVTVSPAGVFSSMTGGNRIPYFTSTGDITTNANLQYDNSTSIFSTANLSLSGTLTGAGDWIYTQTNHFIRTNTGSGSDTRRIGILGGGAAGSNRGAAFYAYGNNFSSNAGSAFVHAGNVASGHIYFSTGGTDRIILENDGDFFYNANAFSIGPNAGTFGAELMRVGKDGIGTLTYFRGNAGGNNNLVPINFEHTNTPSAGQVNQAIDLYYDIAGMVSSVQAPRRAARVRVGKEGDFTSAGAINSFYAIYTTSANNGGTSLGFYQDRSGSVGIGRQPGTNLDVAGGFINAGGAWDGNPGGWNATIRAAGTNHARLRAHATAWNTDAYLYVDTSLGGNPWSGVGTDVTGGSFGVRVGGVYGSVWDLFGFMGLGTVEPQSWMGGYGVGSGAGERLLHVKGTQAIVGIQGSTHADIWLADSNAGVNDRWMVIRTDGGQTDFMPHTDAGSIKSQAITIRHSDGTVRFARVTSGYSYTAAWLNVEASGTAYFQANDGATVNVRLAPGGHGNPYNFFRRGTMMGPEDANTIAVLDVRQGDGSSVIAAFGNTTSVNSSYPGYIYFSATNTMNSGYAVNGATEMWINYRGYNNGFAHSRSLQIGDGKGNRFVYFDGASGRVGIWRATAPGYTLDVNGTLGVSGEVSFTGSSFSFAPGGSVFDGIYVNASEIRLRNNSAFYKAMNMNSFGRFPKHVFAAFPVDSVNVAGITRLAITQDAGSGGHTLNLTGATDGQVLFIINLSSEYCLINGDHPSNGGSNTALCLIYESSVWRRVF